MMLVSPCHQYPLLHVDDDTARCTADGCTALVRPAEVA